VKTPNILKLMAATLFLVATTASAQSGTIVGSGHDFSWAGWSNNEICIVCHAAHNNLNLATELLWNHTESSADYTVYSSPTFNQPAGQPAGSSKLCLSCHDGTVAVDSFGGATGSLFISDFGSGLELGTDLSNDHPISFTYVVGEGEELNPVATTVTFGDGSGGTIADMLFGGQVECSSCHDVHNTKSDS
jgi:hypothetical protein